MSVDTASKGGLRNDYSVITFWYVSDDRYCLDHVWRDRVEYPDLKRMVLAWADEVKPATILIEDKGAGTGLIQDLKAEDREFQTVAYDPGSLDKETRMRIQSAKIENGKVWLPERQLPWLDTFLDEIRRFPGGTHNDQVDSVSQFIDWITTKPDIGKLLVIR